MLGNFDFSGKKVRKNGQVLDKYSLAQELKQINYWRYLYASDIMSYNDMKHDLYSLLNN